MATDKQVQDAIEKLDEYTGPTIFEKKVPFTEFKQGFRNALSAAKKDIENARK